MSDPYFQSKFPSKIVRKKKIIPYKKYRGHFNCFKCNATTVDPYLIIIAGAHRLVGECCAQKYV